MNRSLFLSFAIASFSTSVALGDAPAPATPRPVAATREELKRQLEESKHSRPRLPLPPPTAEEVAKAEARSRSGAGGLGGIINNGRMRQLYLPAEFVGGGFSREPDPAMSLSPAFKTMLFWIVSRANNCAYCQGHQEVKLSADGVTEATIAALDGDWSEFTPAERAAFAFTKKVTYQPHEMQDRDLDALRQHYKEDAILEILYTVAGNNAMNRWTGALAIPQEDHRLFLTPTPEKYANLDSLVAPLDPTAERSSCARPAERGPLENRAEVTAMLAAARARRPRLLLVDDAKSKALIGDKAPSEAPLPNWMRLLARFPKQGVSRIGLHRSTEEKGTLSPLLTARIAWVAARQDRAWYALDLAKRRLNALGESEEAIFAVETTSGLLSLGEQSALALVKKLTVDPALVTDADIEGLRRHYSDRQVAEIVFQTTEAAFFNRLTEAAGLPLDP